VRHLEAKSRRRDILEDEEAIYAFYAERIPSGIYSTPQFEKWLRKVSGREPKLLHMRINDITRSDAAQVTADDFPDVLQVGASALPLEYHFDPGHQADGVTLVVPLPLINQVSRDRCDWLVPGLLEARIIALLRGLPKQLRKGFVPIPDTARRLVGRLEPSDRPLIQAIGEALKDMTGVQVPEDAWSSAEVPEHLTMNYRLVDDKGREIAHGDDLASLKKEYGARGEAVFSHIPSNEIERDGITRWDFGDLPETLDLNRAGIRLRGYPALVDQGGSVAIQVLDSAETAAAAQRDGLRRLLMLHLGTSLRYLRKNLPGLGRLRLQYAKAPQGAGGTGGDLADELIALILDLTFIVDRPAIRTQQAFEERLGAHESDLPGVGNQVCELASAILSAYQALRKRLDGVTQINWMQSVMDIRAQLDGLVYRGFLQQVPYERLKHYPRYLKAADQRAEKLLHAAGRDRERMAEMAPLQKKWWERCKAAREAGRRDPRLDEIRWLLEELRVSLFAQQLGTSEPVSIKRIETRWKELGL